MAAETPGTARLSTQSSPRRGSVDKADKGAVQSVERALDIIGAIADAGTPQTLSQLASAALLPVPTAHRLVQTLMRRGYIRQDPFRRYTLGAKLMHLGDVAGESLSDWAIPYLTEVRDFTGESANLALLDGWEVVYVAQAASRHRMRMFTEHGRRVLPHGTAVGKALLADLTTDRVQRIISATGLPAHTERTITDPGVFLAHIEDIRRQGYAVDEEEHEIGVRCLAVTVPDAVTRLAISVSGPAVRMTAEHVERAIPMLQDVAARLSSSLVAADPPASAAFC